MIKKKNSSQNNVVKFPSKLTDLEKQIEAVIFAAAEPLDVDTIESKISKKTNVLKSLEKLQNEKHKPRVDPIILSPLSKKLCLLKAALFNIY